MPSLPPNFVYPSHPARVIFGSGTSAQLTKKWTGSASST